MRSIFYYILSKINKIQNTTSNITSDVTNIKNKSRIAVSITAGQTVHVTDSYSPYLLSLNKILSDYGTAFELITEGENAGKIKVKKSCIVEITGTIGNAHNSNVTAIIGVRVNNSVVCYAYDSVKSDGYNTVNITAKPWELQENDIISLVISSDTSNTDIQISTENLFYLYIKEI